MFFMLVSIVICAQTTEDESLYNDSTEFFLKPQMIVDTVKVEAIASAYKEKCKADLAAEFASKREALTKYSQDLEKLLHMGVKEKLSAENGTLDVYTQLFNELKYANRQFTNTSRAAYFISVYSSLGWESKYNREKDNAEKLLLKKQKPHPVIMQYVSWVYLRNMSEIDNLDKMNDNKMKYFEDISKNAFYWYNECEGTDVYPEKQVYVKVENENYRPKVFCMGYDALDELDVRLQKRGWEWAEWSENREDIIEAEENYPYKYRCYSFNSHPEYRFVDHAIYDKDGNLIRYPYISLKGIEYGDSPDIIKILLMMEYRKDYVNNKYNIKSENKEVQYVIVNKLGMSKESNVRIAQAIIKGVKGGLRYKYSDDWNESIKGYNQREKAVRGMLSEVYRLQNETAVNFLNQLEKDHADDYNYIYKIERLSNVSFKVHFVTKNIKPKCDVVITYYQKNAFSCDWRIDDIVQYDTK